MRILQLHYFYALAKFLNYSQAAKALHISQSVLSQQINNFEYELGFSLFEHTKKGLSLTPAGTELMKHLPGLFKQIEQTFSLIHAQRRETPIPVRIGFERPICDVFISDYVRGFNSLNPDISCMATQYSFEQLSVALEDDEIDIGFFMMPNPHVPCCWEFKRISTDSLVLVFRKEMVGCTATLENITHALDGKSIFCFEESAGGTEHIYRLCTMLNINPNLYFCYEVDEVICNIESGSGIAILPRGYVEHTSLSENLMMVDLTDLDETSLCIVAAFKPDKCTPIMRQFLDHLPSLSTNCAECVNKKCSLKHKKL